MDFWTWIFLVWKDCHLISGLTILGGYTAELLNFIYKFSGEYQTQASNSFYNVFVSIF